MGKNIIVCSDGTGNTAIKGRGTNVFKIFESVDLNSHRFDPELPPQVARLRDLGRVPTCARRRPLKHDP